jgi:hypothetical protein
MKFLLPVGGVTNHLFGILTSPAHPGIPSGIVSGMPWAADNDAFKKGFNPDVFFSWLETMRPYRDTCLFVAVPDVPYDAEATLDNFKRWSPELLGWPLAFVAQDGLEELPDLEYSTLFIGGSTEYKLSNTVGRLTQDARKIGKRIHIGRVNYKERYDHFALLEGSEEFTCDGTRPRFEGVKKTIIAWSRYMAQRPLHRVVPDRDCAG